MPLCYQRPWSFVLLFLHSLQERKEKRTNFGFLKNEEENVFSLADERRVIEDSWELDAREKTVGADNHKGGRNDEEEEHTVARKPQHARRCGGSLCCLFLLKGLYVSLCFSLYAVA